MSEKMRLLYESATGGIVAKEYDYTTQEETQNLAAAKVLADLGKKVLLLKTSDIKGQKTADCQIDGEKWEIKTVSGERMARNPESVVDSAFKHAKGQSKNIILNDTSEIKIEIVKACINKRIFNSKWIEKVMLVKRATAEIFSRETIIGWYQDEKIRKIVNKMRNKRKK